MKLSRKALDEGLETLPMSAILGKRVSDALTPKQREFARKVAQGKSKAQAYREAFNPNPAPSTIITTPYKVAADPRVQREIEAYALALEAEKHRSPAALRSLVIQTLTQVLIDPDTKPAVRINAAKVLGTVTEVAAFTERKEVRTISSSEDARAKVMAELRALVSSGAEDVTVIEADSLLQELAGVNINADPDADPAVNINAGGESDTDRAVNINAGATDGNAEPEAQTPPEGHPPDA